MIVSWWLNNRCGLSLSILQSRSALRTEERDRLYDGCVALRAYPMQLGAAAGAEPIGDRSERSAFIALNGFVSMMFVVAVRAHVVADLVHLSLVAPLRAVFRYCNAPIQSTDFNLIGAVILRRGIDYRSGRNRLPDEKWSVAGVVPEKGDGQLW